MNKRLMGEDTRKPNTIRKNGKIILNSVRKRIKDMANGDYDVEFKINRYIYSRLQLDERNLKDKIRKKLKSSKCHVCGKTFTTIKGVHLHRLDETRGYHMDNCVFVHRKCHYKLSGA